METLITLSKIYIPLIIVLGSIFKIWYKSHKDNQKNFEKLVGSVIETNESMKDNYIELNLKLEKLLNQNRELIINFNKMYEPLIVKDGISASIIKDAIFYKQGFEFVDILMNIYLDNNILEKPDYVKEKIKTSINKLLHTTNNKLRNIKGIDNYLVPFDQFLKDVEEIGVFKQIYELFVECKTHNNLEVLKREIMNVYNLNLQKLSKMYKF